MQHSLYDVWTVGDGPDIEACLREDIANGEFEMAGDRLCTRIYLPYEQLSVVLDSKPKFVSGGIRLEATEPGGTCIAASVDPDMANWLRGQGIRLEVIRESEIRQ